MTPKQILQRAQTETLADKNGDRVELLVAPGLSRDEIVAFEKDSHITIPREIRALLEYSRGFTLRSKWASTQFYEDEQGLTAALRGRGCVWHPVWMDSVPAGLAPAGLEVVSDICDNSWAVEIRPPGEWGAVFYVCHDPPLIAFQAKDLAGFLLELFMLFSKNQPNHLITDAKRIEKVPLYKAAATRDSGDPVLKAFAATLKDDDVIADLREKRVGTGFSWDVFGKATRLKRHEKELLFGLTKPERKGFLRRMFGGS